MIASFHIVHFKKRHLVQSKKTNGVAGLRYWKPLSIGPDFKALPDNFSRWALAKPNFRRWGFFGVWEDKEALDVFNSESSITRRWHETSREVWHARLTPKRSSGTWHGSNPLENLDQVQLPSGPVAMLTRGELHLRKVPTFWLETTRVAVTDIRKLPGFLAGVALVELPLVEVMTFTLWDSADSVMNFARRRPAHSSLIERDKHDRIFRAFFYAQFFPSESSGTWYREDPLARFSGADLALAGGIAS